ncbi:MAG: SelT/SelW/SelH family protein [Myxococcota bacterium]
MEESPSLLARAFDRFDAVNAEDPRRETVDGNEVPKELLYARRMTEMLERFAPDASEALRLAVRAQHIGRWKIARSEFPKGRKGYHQWRVRLMELHAELATGILREVGYDEDTVERVGRLVRKKGIKRDPEAQTLEDVACLVFLAHYFDEFAATQSDDKLVQILRKTWGKMSEAGHEAALGLDLGERAAGLVQRALASEPESASPPVRNAADPAAPPAGSRPAPSATAVGDAVRRPRVVITYCTQCGFLLRAAWLAQELLTTFADELGEVALVPSSGGVFEVVADGQPLFSRRETGRFPESKELKQLLRDRIAPGRDLGHSDR